MDWADLGMYGSITRMNETRWKGDWWLPENPEETRPGTLHYGNDDDRLRLELIGGFSIEVRTPTDGGYGIGFDGRFPVIHGSSGGEAFTLLECQATHTSGGFIGSSITDQTIGATSGLRGILVEDGDEKVFDSMVLQLEHLLAWSAKSSLRAEAELDSKGRWTGKQTATSIPTDDQIALSGDLTLTLRVPHTQFRVETKHGANSRSVESCEYAEIVVASVGPSSLNDFGSTAKALQDLLTLAAFGPSGILKRSFWYESSSAHPAHGDWPHEVQVMGNLVYKPGTGANSDSPRGYLFTLADVDFGDLVPAWLAIYQQAWLPCSMLFGTQYLSPGYTGTRLFTIASAAEGLHRSLHDSLPLSDRDFEAALKKVLTALLGVSNKPARKLVHEQLHNDLPYRQRLCELAKLPDQEAVEALLPDIDRWVKLLKDARNGTAHADDQRQGTQPEATLAFWLSQVTYVLLCLVLMAEVNLPSEVQRRAVRTPEVTHAIGEFRRASTTHAQD